MLIAEHMNDYHNKLMTVIKSNEPCEGAPILDWESADLSEERARKLTSQMNALTFPAALVR